MILRCIGSSELEVSLGNMVVEKKETQAREMALWLKASAAKADNLNLIPRIHMKGETTPASCPLTP